jgi:aspartate 1-decarboxylase
MTITTAAGLGFVTLGAIAPADPARRSAAEQVQVVDIDNGARLVTYVIEGPAGSGVIGINGAAARLVSVGDLIIVMSFHQVDERERARHRPRVVHVDARNEIVDVGTDPSTPVPGAEDQRSGALTEFVN